MDQVDFDDVSGKTTTGHQWDGIKELNTPLPRWWIVTFYLTIVWAIGYWIVYPAWPMIWSHTTGVLQYSSRADVAKDVAALEALRSEKMMALDAAPLSEIETNPALLALARARGKAAFGDNCAGCHGSGGAGAKGFPNLNDDDWLWGGSFAQIDATIRYGIRSGHPKAHEGAMPAFGRDGILKKDEVVAVANFVRSLSGLPTRPRVDVAAGRKVFAETCAACHGESAKGNQDVGAPDLTDAIWLYGADEASLIETITNGRSGVMPSWSERLDPATIKALTVYVHALGGGK